MCYREFGVHMKSLDTTFPMNLMQSLIFLVCVYKLYSRCQYNVSVPFKKPVVLRRTNIFKTVTVYHFFTVMVVHFHPSYGIYTLTISMRHFPSKSINEKSRTNRQTRAKLARSEAIDEKSRNNQWTEVERATRRAETIDGLERKWKQSMD